MNSPFTKMIQTAINHCWEGIRDRIDADTDPFMGDEYVAEWRLSKGIDTQVDELEPGRLKKHLSANKAELLDLAKKEISTTQNPPNFERSTETVNETQILGIDFLLDIANTLNIAEARISRADSLIADGAPDAACNHLIELALSNLRDAEHWIGVYDGYRRGLDNPGKRSRKLHIDNLYDA